MDKKLFFKSFFKIILANIVLSIIIDVVYIIVEDLNIEFFNILVRNFNQSYVLKFLFLFFFICFIGWCFRFENEKESWIAGNIVGIIGVINESIIIVDGFSFGGIQEIVCIPFIWIDRLDYYFIRSASEILGNVVIITLIILCQNLFLTPTLIKDRIQNRKISHLKPPEKVVETVLNENVTN